MPEIDFLDALVVLPSVEAVEEEEAVPIAAEA
jgi:hypothetical protein